MSKLHTESVGLMITRSTYKGQSKQNKKDTEYESIVFCPTRIGPNLQQWLDKVHKKEEVRKQA